VEVVASLSQGRTAAAQWGLFTHKSVPVIFESPCNFREKLGNHTRKTFNRLTTKTAIHIIRTVLQSET